jgi:putative ABC transport system permease protein
MTVLWQDMRYGARMLLRQPGFTLIAILTLALGIGANSAVFSVANAVIFRPLDFHQPDQLVMIWERHPKEFSGEAISVTAPDFLYWREHNQSFEGLAVMAGRTYSLTGAGEPERLSGLATSANLISLLGIQPALGRGFIAEEEQTGKDQVAVISYGFWQRRFGSSADAIGQQIILNSKPYEIVGVLPQGFQLPTGQPDILVPLPFTARDAENRGGHMLRVIGRIKPDVSMDQAQIEINELMNQLGEQYPKSNAGWTAPIVPLREEGVTDAKPALFVLLGAVGFLLLIACANVANLLLARSTARSREFAVRAALGAGRWRLARQLFTESLMLTVCGGALGLIAAIWCIDFFTQLGPHDIPRLEQASLDWRVILFTMTMTLATAILSSLAPVIRSLSANLNESLKEGSRGTSKGLRGLRTIMVLQIGLALVLLVGAGLLIRSYSRLTSVNPGVRTENVLTLSISPPVSKYGDDRRRSEFFQNIVARVSSLPGIESAAITQNLPLTRSRLFFVLSVEGVPAPPPGEPQLEAEFHPVSPDYFSVLGIPLLKGRAFDERDSAGAVPVIIISESMVRRYFPDRDPIGRKIHILANDQPPREIIGVAGETRHFGLDKETAEEMYVPYQQFAPFTGVLVARTTASPLHMVGLIKEQVWAIDNDQPVFRISTMEQILSESVAGQRFNTLLIAVFAGIALLLAGVGIYGVMSYSVSQSTQELGIRLALGAQRGDIIRLVVGKGLVLTLAGIGLGVAGAFALTRLLSSLLFEVSTTDPATFVVVSLLLTGIALLACYLPARRAMKVDPIVALRYE